MRSTAAQRLSLHQAAEKKGLEYKSDQLSRQKMDAYQAVLSSDLPEAEKKPDRVAQEVLTLLVGGSATAMRVMSRIIFHVVATPQVLGKMRSELDAVMSAPSVQPELEVLEQQRYLVGNEAVLF